MGHYKSNVRDIEFNLFEVFARQDVLGTGPYAEMDVDTARSVLDEVRRLAETELAESFVDADRNPPVFDPETSTVVIPESFKKSFKTLMDAEWYRMELPEDWRSPISSCRSETATACGRRRWKRACCRSSC